MKKKDTIEYKDKHLQGEWIFAEMTISNDPENFKEQNIQLAYKMFVVNEFESVFNNYSNGYIGISPCPIGLQNYSFSL